MGLWEMTTVISGIVRSFAVLSLAAGVAQAAPADAEAQAKSLSDESVLTIMNYAWLQTPPRFTKPDNTVVEIDKGKPGADEKQRQAVTVPVDVAREVIIAGRRSALAQICNVEEHQIANYRSLMQREVQKKKWSEQQVVYINMIHLTTVQIYAGNATIREKDQGGKVIEEKSIPNRRAQSCTEAEAAKLKEQIEAYVAQGPTLDPALRPAGSPPASAAEATPMAAEKK